MLRCTAYVYFIHGVGPFGWYSECNHGRNSVPLYVHEVLEVLEVVCLNNEERAVPASCAIRVSAVATVLQEAINRDIGNKPALVFTRCLFMTTMHVFKNRFWRTRDTTGAWRTYGRWE